MLRWKRKAYWATQERTFEEIIEDLAAYVVALLLLLIRPSGLFRQKLVERVREWPLSRSEIELARCRVLWTSIAIVVGHGAVSLIQAALRKILPRMRYSTSVKRRLRFANLVRWI